MNSGSFGIVHVQVGVDVSSLDFDDVGLLPFLSLMMREGGTKDVDDVLTSRAIDIHTGGIAILVLTTHAKADWAGDKEDRIILVDPNDDDDLHVRTMLLLVGKSTVEESSVLLDLLFDLLQFANMDNYAKAVQVLDRSASDIRAAIQSRGHSYAVSRIKSRYCPLAFIQERLSGVSQLEVLEGLKKQVEEDWDGVRNRLDNMIVKIADSLVGRKGSAIGLTGDIKDLRGVKRDAKALLTAMGLLEKGKASGGVDDDPHPWLEAARMAMAKKRASMDTPNEGIVISSQVNYVAKGGLLYNQHESIKGSSAVVLQYLKRGYLWHTVREQNGAYGVTTDIGHWIGSLYFVSYRDASPLSTTLKAYDEAADDIYRALAAGEVDSDTIKTAIIGSIGAIDGSAPPPSTLASRSFTNWLTGHDHRYRQRWRHEILETEEADFANFADRLKNWMDPCIVAVGSNAAFQDAQENGLKLNLVSTDPSD